MAFNSASINLAAAADEEAYQLWLRDPSAACGHIVTLRYNGTSAVYNNWVNYELKLSDFPLAGYREVIKSLPSLSRQISENLTGVVAESIGELVLDNTDGSLDQWHNLAFDGQPCNIYQGDPSWLPERFRLICKCVAEIVTGATRDQIAIRLRSVDYGANKPIQTDLIPPAVGSTAPSNTPIPLAYGQVFNITPAVVDQVNLLYQWNDGAGTSVTAGRDSGIPFQTDPIAISAVNTGTDVLSTATAHGFYAGTRVRCDGGSLPVAAFWRFLLWNGDIFLAVSGGGGGSTISATSRNGQYWEDRTLPASINWIAGAWNGSIFCIAAYGSDVAATSPDGITWTTRTLPSAQSWSAMSWNGSVFCLISYGTVAATSPDGITWAARTLPSSANWHSIAWGGTVFCVVANSDDKAATSPDGITWTARTLPANDLWTKIVWNGSIFCVAASASTAAATSPDGITWTTRTLPASSAWVDMVWTGSFFCLLATASYDVATSPDGITWSLGVMPDSNLYRILGWNGYNLCAIGDGLSTLVTLSRDGVTWTSTLIALPAPLATETDYWVSPRGLTTTNFKLCSTRGASTDIDITSSTTGAVIVGHHWTADLTTGKVYLDSSPDGEFTIDGVAGSTSAATILPTVLGTANVDTISQSRFAVTCAQTVGIYINERRNRIDVATDIMAGLGAWYGYSRTGQLQFGRIEASYTTYDVAIPQDYMDSDSFRIARIIPPKKQHRAGYRKNWTDQTGKLAAAVSLEMAGLYSLPYSVTAPALGADEGSDGSEFHLLAEKPDAFETMMALGSEALAEALRRDTMFYGWGAIFQFDVGKIGSEIDIGKVLFVTHERYGFGSGVNVPVVKIDDKPSEQSSTIFVFRALSAYTPGQL